MTYATQPMTIDLAEHELRSLRRWLNQMQRFQSDGAGAGGKWDIWLNRPDGGFARPALMLTETNRIREPRGRSWVCSKGSWQVEVLAESFWDAKHAVSDITQRLLRTLRIPLYLWSWQYLRAQVTEDAGNGSIPAGQVSVRVSAVNVGDEESLAGPSEVVAVAANAAVEVLIPPWPREGRVAKEYRVYAGSVGAEVLEATVTGLPDAPVPVVHTLTSLAGTGDPVPTDSVFFHRFMCVDEASVQDRVMEHPELDGVFNGFVTFTTDVTTVRDPVAQWPKAVADIEISDEVVS